MKKINWIRTVCVAILVILSYFVWAADTKVQTVIVENAPCSTAHRMDVAPDIFGEDSDLLRYISIVYLYDEKKATLERIKILEAKLAREKESLAFVQYTIGLLSISKEEAEKRILEIKQMKKTQTK